MSSRRSGEWPSPLSASAVAAASLRLELVAVEGEHVYWIEGRPSEEGRYVVVRGSGGSAPVDVTPAGTNVRTRVHEYGGGACLVSSGTLYYSEFTDQRLYRLAPDEPPRARTPSGPWRYADAAIHPSGRWLMCVREDHSSPAEPVNTIVRIPTDGPMTPGEVVASGHDFYSTPRISPDGRRVCWLAWDHPQMPWDGTELWAADITADGNVSAERMIAGGPEESIFQPGWSPGGELYFVSDWTGWWNLYRESCVVNRESSSTKHDPRSTMHEPVCPMHADCGWPQWLFGMSTWAFAGPERIVLSFHDLDGWHVATLDTGTGECARMPIAVEPGHTLLATPQHAVFIGGSPHSVDAVVKVGLDDGRIDVLRAASEPLLESADISSAEAVAFPTEGGLTAYAFYYAPRNSRVEGRSAEAFALRDERPFALRDERPPLLVVSHGGPTSAAETTLNLEIQYWTTRGFAVVDVDYGGSSGHGRPYRQRLNGRWGVVDVDDCVNAAKYLVEQGRADAARLIIRGRSAGGFTTLAALTTRPEVFAAAASHYGVSDLEVLARDTHKFEARYMDRLVGPYPAMAEIYRQRSPIHDIDRLSCPLILFQGVEDTIVPPNQAEAMANAVRGKGLPVALVMFEGEQHGFRRADSIVRALEAELAFYGAVFGFSPAGSLAPVSIDNLERWKRPQ